MTVTVELLPTQGRTMAVDRTAQSPTPFARLCAQRGLLSPSLFLPAFAETARQVGEDASVTARQFQRWRGRNPPAPRPAHLRVLHALFGVSPQNMGFPVPGPLPSASPAPGLPGPNLDIVDRREFLGAGAAAGAAACRLIPAGNPTPPLAAGAPVGAAHVRELRLALANLYALDDAFGGADVRPLAVRLLRRIRRVINTCDYPDTIGRQLQLAAAQTAEHCGWLSFDAWHQDDARRYWGEALATARVLHDEPLEVVVLASMSLQALYENRAREARDLARAAQDRAANCSSPAVLSLLAVREAYALARMQDQAGARRALALSMRLMEKGGNGRVTPDWASFHGPAELTYAQGQLYAEAGHYKAAVPYVHAALSQQYGAYGRNRALYRLTLAGALIRSGEVEHGCAELISTAHSLDEIGSARARRQINTIEQVLRSIDAADARHAVEQLSQITQQSGCQE